MDRLEIGVESDGGVPATAVRDLILATDGVMAAEPLQESPGRTAWRIGIDPAHGERAVGRDVIDRLLAANIRLERFGRSRPSLEQIYRRAVERLAEPGPGTAGRSPT